MYIKVFYKGAKELDVIGNIDCIKIINTKNLVLAYRGEDYRSLFLGDIEKIILKED